MATSQQHVETVVAEAIAAYLSTEAALIRMDTQLDDEFGVDSTELIGIIVEIEKTLGISLKGVDYAKLKTPEDLVAVIMAISCVEEPA